MNYGLLFALFVIPFVVQLIVGRINRSVPPTGAPPTSTLQTPPYYPSSYKALSGMLAIFILIIPMGLAVLFLMAAWNTGLLSDVMRRFLSPDAFFFNPSTALKVASICIFMMILEGGIASLALLTALLPKNFRSYINGQGNQQKTAQASAQKKWLLRFVNGLYVILTIVAIAGLPFFSALNRDGLSHLSFYPLHETIPFSDINGVEARCSISTDSQGAAVASVEVLAETTKGNVAIIPLSLLPISAVSPDDLAKLTHQLAAHGIAVHKNGSEACLSAAGALTTDEGTRQYEAIFGS